MSPYILLRDEARTKSIDTRMGPAKEGKANTSSTRSHNPAAQGFLSYVDSVLDRKTRRSSSNAVLGPLDHLNDQRAAGRTFSSKEAIDLAILRSNHATSSNRSANRFEIARNGRRIAVVVLNRPSHRLGETVMATVDFSEAEIPCYSLRATLETSEKINPSLALRSTASISRATRRVHASHSENTLFAARVLFSPTIPVSSSPTILTSGVNLEWDLRFEFATTRLNGHEEDESIAACLLEKVSQDDRGTVLAAMEAVSCETFEVAVPLIVYGENIKEAGNDEVQGLAI